MKSTTRLFLAAFLAAFAIAPAAANARGPGILLQNPANASFLSSPGVPACTSFAVLRGDMAKTGSTLMVRMKSGCIVPYHFHTPSEEIVVLQGIPLAQMRGQRPVYLKVGSYSQLPSKHVHRFRCTTKVDCILFMVADGPFDIHYVDDSGKEISADKALAASAKARNRKW